MVTNAKLIQEIVSSKAIRDANTEKTPQECMTPALKRLIIEMIEDYVRKPFFIASPRYKYYDPRMNQGCIEALGQHWFKFNEKRENADAHSFFSSIIQCRLAYLTAKDKKRLPSR